MAQRATLQLPSLPATVECSIDAWQRSILFLDVLRRRAAQFEKHAAQTAAHVLDYEAELVLDGRSLERPVNYALVRIIPSEGVDIDPLKRPLVVVDPRAGNGPGIGGFKADSEIGVAMKARRLPARSRARLRALGSERSCKRPRVRCRSRSRGIPRSSSPSFPSA